MCCEGLALSAAIANNSRRTQKRRKLAQPPIGRAAACLRSSLVVADWRRVGGSAYKLLCLLPRTAKLAPAMDGSTSRRHIVEGSVFSRWGRRGGRGARRFVSTHRHTIDSLLQVVAITHISIGCGSLTGSGCAGWLEDANDEKAAR